MEFLGVVSSSVTKLERLDVGWIKARICHLGGENIENIEDIEDIEL